MIGWYFRKGGPHWLWQGGRWELPADLPARSILLSFDDGPSANSLRCAEVLAKLGIRALFFLVAERAATRPDLCQELVAQGHTIGSHGLIHKRHTRLSSAAVQNSLLESRRILQECSGQDVLWFRPPFGAWWPWQNRLLAQSGMRALFWNLNPRDYSGISAPRIRDRVLSYRRRSSILLLHCTGRNEQQTLVFLQDHLEELNSDNWIFADPALLRANI